VVDANAAPEATLFCWRLATLDGTTLAASTHALAGARAPVEPLPLPGMEPFFAVNRREDMVLWLCLKDARGCVVARDKALFAPPRCLALQDPGISLDVSQIADESGEQVFRVGVSASAPAFGVSILLPGIPALVEDSFFDIEPDETVEVHVATLRNVGETEFRAALRAMSLFDL
ncbi:MAG: hypothetical protein IJS46_03695, partial [Kiritimatiellae bacterium]|nr:hypothetical protein [Kiritimatiellia bacterium]